MKKIHSKLKALEWSQHFSHYMLWGFSRCTRAANSTVQCPIWPNFKPVQDFMGVLVAWKNEEDPIKNEGARVVTALFIDFSDAQAQLTPRSVMESCRNSNSSKLVWLVLLPAKMKKIYQKMKALEWSQHFSHYKSMGIFPDAQGQLTPQSKVWSGRISNPSEILCVSLLPARMKKIQLRMKALEWSQHYSLIFHT